MTHVCAYPSRAIEECNLRLSAINCVLIAGGLSLCPSPASSEPVQQLPAWNYVGGANNDEGWGELSSGYAACSSGTQQSPVAIDSAKPTSMMPLRTRYRDSVVAAQLRENTLILQFQGNDNTLEHEGTSYVLKQVRAHTPAEHSIQGALRPLEWHLIHQAKNGGVLIVAVQSIEAKQASSRLDTLFTSLPSRSERERSAHINPNAFLPEQQGFYAYTGSLTWPPCTEGVEWRVMKSALPLTREQLRVIGTLLGRNARLLQPLYLRDIRETRE